MSTTRMTDVSDEGLIHTLIANIDEINGKIASEHTSIFAPDYKLSDSILHGKSTAKLDNGTYRKISIKDTICNLHSGYVGKRGTLILIFKLSGSKPAPRYTSDSYSKPLRIKHYEVGIKDALSYIPGLKGNLYDFLDASKQRMVNDNAMRIKAIAKEERDRYMEENYSEFGDW